MFRRPIVDPNTVYSHSSNDIKKESDVIKILEVIMSMSYTYESKSYPFLAVHKSMKAFYASYQQNKTSCVSYLG